MSRAHLSIGTALIWASGLLGATTAVAQTPPPIPEGFNPAGEARPWEAEIRVSPYSLVNLRTGQVITRLPVDDCPAGRWCFNVEAPLRSWRCEVQDAPNPRRLLEIKDGLAAGQPRLFAFTYNDWGQLLTITDPQNNTWTYEYDTQGRLSRVIDPAPFQGQTQTFAYTLLSNPTRRRVIYTDRRGKLWRYIFDDLGRLITARNPLLQERRFVYDAAWNISQFTNELNKTWNATYDGSGNLLTLTDPLMHKWQWTYDTYNNVTSITPPLDNAGGLDASKLLTAQRLRQPLPPDLAHAGAPPGDALLHRRPQLPGRARS